MSFLRTILPFLPSIVLGLFAWGAPMVGIQGLAVGIILTGSAILLLLIPLWIYMPSIPMNLLRYLITGFLLLLICTTGFIIYYLKGKYIPDIENKSQKQTIQLTPDELDKQISLWLSSTVVTHTRISDDNAYFHFQISYNNGLVQVSYPKKKNQIEVAADLHLENEGKQILEQITSKERNQWVWELQSEMLKCRDACDVHYEGLEYPFIKILIYKILPTNVTQPVFLESIDKVLRARQLLVQIINKKIDEMQPQK